MNYCIYNGINSNTIAGLIIQELPPIVKPRMRTEITEIEGRDGDIVDKLGYASYDKSIQIGLFGNYDIDAIAKFFSRTLRNPLVRNKTSRQTKPSISQIGNIYGTVTFSNEVDTQ